MSNLEGKHKDEKWILEVENSLDIGGNNIPQTIETLEINRISTFNDSHEVVSKPLDKTVSKTKLLERANLYFDKMWYAEAAELYEDALSKGDKFYSKEIIQKAADAIISIQIWKKPTSGTMCCMKIMEKSSLPIIFLSIRTP